MLTDTTVRNITPNTAHPEQRAMVLASLVRVTRAMPKNGMGAR